MTNFQTLSLTNLEFLYFDSEIEIEQLIYDGEGQFSDEFGVCYKVSEDYELFIDFRVSASGKIDEYSGDYYHPPYCDVSITELEVSIKEVYINGDIFKMNKDSILELEKLIKNKIW